MRICLFFLLLLFGCDSSKAKDVFPALQGKDRAKEVVKKADDHTSRVNKALNNLEEDDSDEEESE